MASLRQQLSRLKMRFPRLGYAVRYLTRGQSTKRKRFAGKSAEEVFSEIYHDNVWGSEESRSGSGSTMDATADLRANLPRIVRAYNIRTFLDAPCGDYNWMRHLDLPVEQYIGGDIVPDIAVHLNEAFGNEQRTFRQLNLIEDELPDVDMLFCRDCLQHLSPEQAVEVIRNFKRSSIPYLMTTTFPNVPLNTNGFTGGTNTFNLQRPPFGFPEPLEMIEDHGSGGEVYQRYMAVWRREDL